MPITLATDVKPDYDPDDMKIVSQDRRLLRVGKQLELNVVNGESIGMMVFRDEGIGRFSDKLDYLMRYGEGLNRWYLSAIDALAQEWSVGICPIQGLSWCEVDNRADLSRAELEIERWLQARGPRVRRLPGKRPRRVNATMEKFGYPDTLVRDYPHLVGAAAAQAGHPGRARVDLQGAGKQLRQRCPATAFAELRQVTADLETALSRALGYAKLNYLMLMMVDPDVHFHVLPRYPETREMFGMTFADPGWPGPPDISYATATDTPPPTPPLSNC